MPAFIPILVLVAMGLLLLGVLGMMAVTNARESRKEQRDAWNRYHKWRESGPASLQSHSPGRQFSAASRRLQS